MSRILVVEDDEVLRNELIELLRNEGYEAEYISTFSDTAGQIIKSKPDLVLLDINIPELNGELVLRKLRKEADIPVIMVTSRTSESDEVLSMSYGADDYITKPYNPTILMLRISAVIKRTRKQDSSEEDTGEKGIYQYREAAVNTAKGTLSRGEKELVLTKNEMIIFLFATEIQCCVKREIVSRTALDCIGRADRHLRPWQTDQMNSRVHRTASSHHICSI